MKIGNPRRHALPSTAMEALLETAKEVAAVYAVQAESITADERSKAEDRDSLILALQRQDQLRETAEAAAQEAALKLGLEFDEVEEKAEAERLADDAVLASAEAAALRAFEIKRQMEARKLEKADLRLARALCEEIAKQEKHLAAIERRDAAFAKRVADKEASGAAKAKAPLKPLAQGVGNAREERRDSALAMLKATVGSLARGLSELQQKCEAQQVVMIDPRLLGGGARTS